MVFLSSGSKSKSHSFTGSLPASVLKKQAGKVFKVFVIKNMMYHIRYDVKKVDWIPIV